MIKLLDLMFDLPCVDTGGCSKDRRCAHTNCPVWEQTQSDSNWCEDQGIIKINRYGKVTKCQWYKSKMLPVWNFLSRMGVCISFVFFICTIFQTHPLISAAYACAAVAFWQLWRWLEKEKKKWQS